VNKVIRFIFFSVIVRFVVIVGLGLNIRRKELLPMEGPAIIVANHNSHLDTMVLMTMIDSKLLDKIQPVAAVDYFMKNKLLAWFATKVIGIIPLSRKPSKKEDPLKEVHQALNDGKILILFPEGSRGEPEEMSRFKKGISRLAQAHPDVPVIPVYLHGLGMALPKGESLFVPFFCDGFVGEPKYFESDRKTYVDELESQMYELETEYRESNSC
jgi:1-acyl-sn-glycerol-3-phosphate acyltransferase